MKLLIVDDEELTRQGLLSSIDWNALGIKEVFQANDGLNGFKSAETHKPDIILSDVRMPRMDGITMLKKVEALMPDTIFIFMSGYSDKDYLKAAIKLHAISYVEKPLNTEEIKEAVLSAIERHTTLIKRHHAESVQNTVSASQLAFWLTLPYASSKESVDSLGKRFCEQYKDPDLFRHVVTVIIRNDTTTEQRPDFLASIDKRFHDLIEPLHLHAICTERKLHHYVFHLFRKSELTDYILNKALEYLQHLFAPIGHYSIAKGILVSGISHIYTSYTSAVVTLQSTFFYDSGTILCSDSLPVNSPHTELLDGLEASFRHAIKNTNEETATLVCEQLYTTCYRSSQLFAKQVQALYFQLFSVLFEGRKSNLLEYPQAPFHPEGILEVIDGCFNYTELHGYLVDQLHHFFEDLAAHVPENSTVYLVKQYLSKNYSNPDLSIKDISDYICLSVSYLCTIFKSETGRTLNQYLTEYRIKQAKQLLEDPRNSISGISSLVGYNDGNYFGKTFKKYTGMSPSEYRESRLPT